MVETKKERLDGILEELGQIGEIVGTAIISRDGLPIASNVGKKDAETFAAMSAAMQGAAETAAAELDQGEVEQVIIETAKGKVISVGAGKKAILVILADKKANLGLVLLEMHRSVKKISDVLK